MPESQPREDDGAGQQGAWAAESGCPEREAGGEEARLRGPLEAHREKEHRQSVQGDSQSLRQDLGLQEDDGP